MALAITGRARFLRMRLRADADDRDRSDGRRAETAAGGERRQTRLVSRRCQAHGDQCPEAECDQNHRRCSHDGRPFESASQLLDHVGWNDRRQIHRDTNYHTRVLWPLKPVRRSGPVEVGVAPARLDGTGYIVIRIPRSIPEEVSECLGSPWRRSLPAPGVVWCDVLPGRLVQNRTHRRGASPPRAPSRAEFRRHLISRRQPYRVRLVLRGVVRRGGAQLIRGAVGLAASAGRRQVRRSPL